MTYVKTDWKSGKDGGTPITAGRLNNLETQYEKAEQLIKQRVPKPGDAGYNPHAANPAIGATIEFKKYAGYEVDVITVRGGIHALRKLAAPSIQADGALPNNSSQKTPKDMVALSGFRAITNCDASSGGSTPRVVGLNIIEGVPYSNFGDATNSTVGSNREAVIIQRDGSVRYAYATDGKTAAQYVSEGAWNSFGYGPILVKNGEAQNWHTNANFSGFTGTVSSRLILGQTASGDYKILLIAGKSGEYGIAGADITSAAMAEGLYWAMNLDGGGTTQGYWKDSLVHPSTDEAGERVTMTYLAVAAPLDNDYDTGWYTLPPTVNVTSQVGGFPPVSVRRVGSQIDMRLLAAISPAEASTNWKILSDTSLPGRFRAGTTVEYRSVVSAGSGRAAAISVDSSWKINAKTLLPDTTALAGVHGYVNARSFA